MNASDAKESTAFDLKSKSEFDDQSGDSVSATLIGWISPFSCNLKGIYPEFQVIRGFSQKILADLLSYDQIHS